MGDVRERCSGCFALRKDLLRCSKCIVGNSAHYCDKECQGGDWRVHKIFCGRLPVSAAPSNEVRCLYRSYTVQALLLPHDCAEPRLVPVEIPPNGCFHVDSYIPGGPNRLKMWMSEEVPPQIFNTEDYEQPFGAFIAHNHYVTMDLTLPENICTKAIMQARAKSLVGKGTKAAEMFGDDLWKQLLIDAKPWRGNVMLLKTDRWRKLKRESGPTFYDVEMKDIPDLMMTFW
eukprot:CAMPEP_0197717828 /NCGR_PEP_ID=MMETSP1434-20131217/2226_1 /TAXON_ID=265543 /ORGANISM="Minutocellus polymorphus, Strain CCMP3303" /LENGTH=229 /DNA_ID=CAMNT_0043302407 /DNA_START=47 /DNA_END=733 /DNA_ORIENTATION=-